MIKPDEAHQRPADVAQTPGPAPDQLGRWLAIARKAAVIAATVVALALLAGIYVNTRPAGAGGASSGESPADTVAHLSAGVQVTSYVDVLGNALIKRPVWQTKYTEWIWQRPEFVVQALVDELGQVDMYTLTSTSSDFHPIIPMARGSNHEPLRLGIATFSQLDGILESEGVYPANAKFHYSELIDGGGATHERSLILTSSWDGTGVPTPSVDAVDELDRVISLCGFRSYGFSACQTAEPTAQATLAKLRSDLHISGFTLTAPEFDPQTVDVNRSPWILDSACDVPGACR